MGYISQLPFCLAVSIVQLKHYATPDVFSVSAFPTTHELSSCDRIFQSLILITLLLICLLLNGEQL